MSPETIKKIINITSTMCTGESSIAKNRMYDTIHSADSTSQLIENIQIINIDYAFNNHLTTDDIAFLVFYCDDLEMTKRMLGVGCYVSNLKQYN